MSWTDERVARLSKLWAEGRSASQIATDLGGVSRNAVIGKVHRLGLSGRAKSPASGSPTNGSSISGRPADASDAASPVEAAGHSAAHGGAPGGRTTATVASVMANRASGGARPNAGMGAGMGGGRTVGATALKMEPEEEMEGALELAELPHQDAADVVVPMSKRLTLLEINDHTCKWPTGDPQRPDFSFCGHGTKEGTPYCEFHAKLAFQPPSERRRRR